jgi:hypothetical protein
MEKDLEYTIPEKIKSFVWNGAIRGQVYDSYSGIGAISTDLCVLGDIRDLGIQAWKYLTGGQDFDGVVTILSAAGICKIIGIIFGLLAVGIFAWKFKETPLCRP